MDADLVALVRKNRGNHLRIQRRAHRGNEEGRRNVLPVEQTQDARQSVDGAVHAAREVLGGELTAGERHRRVINIETERYSHPCAVRPLLRFQPPAYAEMSILRLQLINAQRQTRHRRGRRRLGCERYGGDEEQQGGADYVAFHGDQA